MIVRDDVLPGTIGMCASMWGAEVIVVVCFPASDLHAHIHTMPDTGLYRR
jgi:hypothetical protein